MTRDRQSNDRPPAEAEIADRLHSAAIHLLRRLRPVDEASGLSTPRFSALSVVVTAGPITVTQLAEAEQVRLPTISRRVKELAAQGLIERAPDPNDRRVQWLQATSKGRRLLQQGRQLRVASLEAKLAELSTEDKRLLARATEILERLALPAQHPRR
jgi:DNA-binding MarR family transcriptional regulator